jgi:hypothetical protein
LKHARFFIAERMARGGLITGAHALRRKLNCQKSSIREASQLEIRARPEGGDRTALPFTNQFMNPKGEDNDKDENGEADC